MQIHIAPEDQYKMTFTYPFGTFAYTYMPFGLCNAPSTFQRLLDKYLLELATRLHGSLYGQLHGNLSKVLTRCIDTNLVLNFEKCHFIVIEGIVLGHLVSNKGIDK
ncbi:Retrovirus-related Pol polyprotein, partial [Mucuna pruriens]